MDYNILTKAIESDLAVEFPDPNGLRTWRKDWTERALGEPAFDGSFDQLYAVEFLSKCTGLPGVQTFGCLDSFLATQDRLKGGFSASDHLLDLLSDSCRWLIGWYSESRLPFFCTHGPGTTVDGLTSFDKWLMKLPSDSTVTDAIDPLCRFPRSPSLLRFNRFAEVPKTSWKMRGICIEECAAQFYQQGIGRLMRFGLRTAGIDLSNQWRTNVSRLKDPDFHTLDLSNASDSISCALIKSVFVGSQLERWEAAMSRVRSEMTVLPVASGHSIEKLESFTSMGNGFCFQLLSVFCTAMCMASIKLTNPSFPWTRKHVLDEYHRTFSVYGDDIVAHARYVPTLRYVLSACGFLVNSEKSSTDGKWRESCGAFVKHTNSGPRMTTSLPRLKSFHTRSLEDVTNLCSLQRRVSILRWDATASVLTDEALASCAGRSVARLSCEDFSKFSFDNGDPFGSALVVLDKKVRASSLRWSPDRCRNYIRTSSGVPGKRDLLLADLSGFAACLCGNGSLPLYESYGNMRALQHTRVYL